MKVIILAAGKGVRLRPLTKNIPKCMVKFSNKEILRRCIECFKATGITDISVVDGYCSKILRERYLNDKLKFYHNKFFSTTNMVYSLFCAIEEMDEEFIVCYGDIIFTKKVILKLLSSKNPISVIVEKNWKKLWKLRMENPLLDAETLKVDENGFITEIGKKPKSYREIEGQYMGLIKVSKPEIKRFIELYNELDNSKKESMYMTEFIQEYILKWHNVKAIPIFNESIEIDTKFDLDVYEKNIFHFN